VVALCEPTLCGPTLCGPGGAAAASSEISAPLDGVVTIWAMRRKRSSMVIGRTHGWPAQVGSCRLPEARYAL
jgi:hypothetical protein